MKESKYCGQFWNNGTQLESEPQHEFAVTHQKILLGNKMTINVSKTRTKSAGRGLKVGNTNIIAMDGIVFKFILYCNQE